MTVNTIRKLTRKAIYGDKEAEKQLRSEQRKLAKRANQRLVRLEQSGVTDSPAYMLALQDIATLTNRKRYFENNANRDIILVSDALLSQLAFLNRQTSTRIGYKTYINNRLKSISNMGIDVTGREKAFDEFMRTDWFNEFIRFDSIAAFQTIDEVLVNNVNVEQINKLFSDYVRGEKDIIDVTYNWEKNVTKKETK